MCNTRKVMRDSARDIRRLSNVLSYDAECLVEDMENYDLWCLGESMHATKVTLQRIIDRLIELDYQVYLTKRDGGNTE